MEQDRALDTTCGNKPDDDKHDDGDKHDEGDDRLTIYPMCTSAIIVMPYLRRSSTSGVPESRTGSYSRAARPKIYSWRLIAPEPSMSIPAKLALALAQQAGGRRPRSQGCGRSCL